MASKEDSPPPIHLTTGIASSLGEIAKIAQQASFYHPKIVQGTPRSFDVARFWGDTIRAKDILNWQASTSVKEGMYRLISKYRLSRESS